MSRSACSSSLMAIDRKERSRRSNGRFIHVCTVESQQPHLVFRIRRCGGATQASNPPMFRRPLRTSIYRFWIFCSFHRHSSSLSFQSLKRTILSTLSPVSWPNSCVMSAVESSSMHKNSSSSRLVRLPIPFGNLVYDSM